VCTDIFTGDQFDSAIPDGVQNWASGEPSINTQWDLCMSLGYTGPGKYDDEACTIGGCNMKHAELNFIEVYIHRKVLDLYIFFLLWST
jgi:hypothetical protein